MYTFTEKSQAGSKETKPMNYNIAVITEKSYIVHGPISSTAVAYRGSNL